MASLTFNRRTVFGIGLGWISLQMMACEPQSIDQRVTRGLDRTDASLARQEPVATRRVEDRPAVLIDGAALAWDDIRPALAEAAGATVISELVLDRALARECAANGIRVSEADLERERGLLDQGLEAEARGGSSGEGALSRVLARRGLGPARFAALLRRNAMMRALVAPQVVLSPSAVEQAYRLRFGEQRRVRLIITRTLAEAEAAAARVRAGESFAAVAAEASTDPSADRGGWIDPVSAEDESYPLALRRAAMETPEAGLSAPFLLEGGAGLLRTEAVIPAREPAGGFESVRAELERDVRTRQERLLMNSLARRLLAAAQVNVLDPALAWSWDRR